MSLKTFSQQYAVACCEQVFITARFPCICGYCGNKLFFLVLLECDADNLSFPRKFHGQVRVVSYNFFGSSFAYPSQNSIGSAAQRALEAVSSSSKSTRLYHIDLFARIRCIWCRQFLIPASLHAPRSLHPHSLLTGFTILFSFRVWVNRPFK